MTKERKGPQDSSHSMCRVKMVKRMVYWGKREIHSLIRAEGVEVEPEETVRVVL